MSVTFKQCINGLSIANVQDQINTSRISHDQRYKTEQTGRTSMVSPLSFIRFSHSVAQEL